jgi:hypothetical protein
MYLESYFKCLRKELLNLCPFIKYYEDDVDEVEMGRHSLMGSALAYKILAKTPEGKRPLGKHSHGLEMTLRWF